MQYERLPSFTEWSENQKPESLMALKRYAVTRILEPSVYPSWTFITGTFRYSTRLPDAFKKSLTAYREFNLSHPLEEMMLLSVVILVEKARPTLSAVKAVYGELDEEALRSGLWRQPIWTGKCWFLDNEITADGIKLLKPYNDNFEQTFNLGNECTPVTSEPPTKTRKPRSSRKTG